MTGAEGGAPRASSLPGNETRNFAGLAPLLDKVVRLSPREAPYLKRMSYRLRIISLLLQPFPQARREPRPDALGECLNPPLGNHLLDEVVR